MSYWCRSHPQIRYRNEEAIKSIIKIRVLGYSSVCSAGCVVSATAMGVSPQPFSDKLVYKTDRRHLIEAEDF